MFGYLLKTPIKRTIICSANYHVKNEVMTFTPKAISQLKKIVQDPTKTTVHLNVKKKGCSGHSYQLELINKDNIIHNTYEGNREIINVDNITLSINPKSVMYILGTRMDYIEDELVSEFVFNNPNVVGKCGCEDSIKFK